MWEWPLMQYTAQQRPMEPGERSDHYIRETGFLPPHWSLERQQVFHAQVNQAELNGCRRWLRRYGVDSDE